MKRIENVKTMEEMIRVLAVEAEENRVDDENELGVGD